MLRGFVAIIKGDSPLPDIRAVADCYRKAAVTFSADSVERRDELKTTDLFITVGTNSFKVNMTQ